MTEIKLENLRSCCIPNTEILEVTHHDGEFGEFSDLPSFTRVLWKNSFGEDSMIFTELWMPDEWNGLFIALGNGGMAGGISRGALAEHTRLGRAAVHTDMGTRDGRTRGIANPDVWHDFGWRSTHMMAVVGKILIAEYYGRNPDYSYFLGASTGGNQAMKMVQCFPEDYDGVLAGVPAHNRSFLHIYMVWMHNHLTTPDGGRMFCEDEVPRITAAAEAFFAAHGDGVPGDTFISYPYIGENTVDDFLAFLSEREPDFTEEQLQALRAVYKGPRDPVTGRQIYNGMPIGAEIYGCGLLDAQYVETPFFDPFLWVFGEGYTGYDFDFHNDVETFSDALSQALNANNPDLSGFASHGGKLIVYSAASDPCVPYPDAMNYCERVWKTLGGYDNVSSFYRWFLVPGMDHGNGGHGINVLWADEENRDLFAALRRWREEGIAPEYITGARIADDCVPFTRRLYPYGSEQFPPCEHTPTCDEYYLKK